MEAAYYNISQLLSWAQAYDDVDRLAGGSSAAAAVLDAYTDVTKGMLAKVGTDPPPLILAVVQPSVADRHSAGHWHRI